MCIQHLDWFHFLYVRFTSPIKKPTRNPTNGAAMPINGKTHKRKISIARFAGLGSRAQLKSCNHYVCLMMHIFFYLDFLIRQTKWYSRDRKKERKNKENLTKLNYLLVYNTHVNAMSTFKQSLRNVIFLVGGVA